MKKFSFSNLLLLSSIFFIILMDGCRFGFDDDTRYISGEGELVSHTIVVDTFTNILHGSIGTMNVTVGDTFSLTLRAQQNIINEMNFFDDDGFFFWGIQGDVKILESDTIVLDIQLPVNLESVKLTGVGNIFIESPKQDEIILDLQGIGNILGYNAEVDDAQVFLSGSGNVQVKVSENLSGILSGSGNIYYQGEPIVNVLVTGAGNVLDDN